MRRVPITINKRLAMTRILAIVALGSAYAGSKLGRQYERAHERAW
jgi:hypothetical protein